MKIIEAKGIQPNRWQSDQFIYIVKSRKPDESSDPGEEDGTDDEDEDVDDDSNWSAVQIVSEVQQIAAALPDALLALLGFLANWRGLIQQHIPLSI